ncbi:hypothetical protein B5S33_g490 [[Candida] boidinii]|nr:hypothetical protein B5S33_g490 [[Candida] boidinii]
MSDSNPQSKRIPDKNPFEDNDTATPSDFNQVLASGKFSAKYLKPSNQQNLDSTNSEDINENDNDNDNDNEIDTDSENDNIVRPVTIEGGFNNIDDSDNNDLSNSVLLSTSQWSQRQHSHQRRQSNLSNLISSSLSKSFSNLKDSSSFSQRSSTVNLRERDLSLSQDNMRNNSRNNNKSAINNNNNSINNNNNNNNNYDTPSPLPEIDVIDPHPELVEEVGKYLVTTDTTTDTNSNIVNNNSNNNNKDTIDNNDNNNNNTEPNEDLSPAGGNFDSLKLQGGDITRGIYNWVNEHTENKRDVSPLKRVASYGSPSRRRESYGAADAEDNDDDMMSVSEMQMPGGFRRSFLVQKNTNNNSSGLDNSNELEDVNEDDENVHSHSHRFKNSSRRKRKQRTTVPVKQTFLTSNFIEFLALYGHFAGEDLRDEEDDANNGSKMSQDILGDYDSESQSESENDNLYYDEESAIDEVSPPISSILSSRFSDHRGRASQVGSGSFGAGNIQSQLMVPPSPYQLQKQARLQKLKTGAINREKGRKRGVSNGKAFLLLLKAFIGTGIVFLPKSFSNGGLLFCNLMIIAFSFVSFYCFIILINTTKRLNVTGYADAGLKLLGKNLQICILASLAMSQIGFASSYTVFVAENLKDLSRLITDKEYGIEIFIAIQLIIFLPLSLTRDLGKLSFTALIADACILFGLIYIYFCSIDNIIINGVSEKISMFNGQSWTLFMGTAVFAYEGIGLLIPIQESMKNPKDFDFLLFLVMVVVTIIFVTLSTIAYLSFGDDVETVILMNFPKNNLTAVIQLLYVIAILLSTPIQVFPAIRIFENYFFSRERKTWKERIRRISDASLTSPLLDQNSNANYDSTSNLRPKFSNSSLNNNNNNSNNNGNGSDLRDPTVNGLIGKDGVLSGKIDPAIKWMKNILRVVVVCGMCLIGYTGSVDLDKFVSLVGSFTCVPLIYIYPPLLYLFCFKDELSIYQKSLNVVILIIGCVLAVYTSYQTISSWI